MPRIRSLKYEYFINEELAQISSEARLLGLGITTLADREGRLADRPLRIKILLFPYHNVDVDHLLNELQSAHFLERYVVEGQRYIQITNFLKHQKPHPKEAASIIPSHEKVIPDREKAAPSSAGSGLGDLGTSVNGSGSGKSSTPRKPRAVLERGTRIPDDFDVTDEIRAWATANAPLVDLKLAMDEFIDYWRGRPGAGGRKLDWPGTFRNRLRVLQSQAQRYERRGTNGTNRESSTERNARNLRENVEYIRDLSRGDSTPDREDPISLLAAGL